MSAALTIRVDGDVSATGEPLLNLHFMRGGLSAMATLDGAAAARLSADMAAELDQATRAALALRLARSAANQP